MGIWNWAKKAGRWLGSTARRVVHKGNNLLSGVRRFGTTLGRHVRRIPIVGGLAYQAGKKLVEAPVIGGLSAKNILEKAEDIGRAAEGIVGRRR